MHRAFSAITPRTTAAALPVGSSVPHAKPVFSDRPELMLVPTVGSFLVGLLAGCVAYAQLLLEISIPPQLFASDFEEAVSRLRNPHVSPTCVANFFDARCGRHYLVCMVFIFIAFLDFRAAGFFYGSTGRSGG